MCQQRVIRSADSDMLTGLQFSFNVCISFCVISDFFRDAGTTSGLTFSGHHCSQMLNNRDNRGQYKSLMTATMHLHVPGSLGHCCALSIGVTGNLRVGPISFLTFKTVPTERV